MKHTAKNVSILLACICLIAAALLPWGAAFAGDAGGDKAEAQQVPALDAEGVSIVVSETEKESLARLFSAANPSDLLLSFTPGENIDRAMWVAGFAAAYESGEADSDSGLFERDPFFTEEAEAHFADLWAAYSDGLNPLDEAAVPADVLPYSVDESVRDSMYYRAENAYMQSLIKGVFGREMDSPEEHARYYDGYFYFGHIGDREERLWFGYDYAVDAVYDLSNGYYRIEGTAALYDYAEGDLQDTKTYEALVKKDAASEYGYFLIAQKFGA